jgi:hypothetical protein
MKKGQGISLETIVVAVLVLLVLIVLIIIFSSRTQPVAELYSKCSDLGGKMIEVEKDCAEVDPDKPFTHPLYKIEKDGKVEKKCCVGKLI